MLGEDFGSLKTGGRNKRNVYKDGYLLKRNSKRNTFGLGRQWNKRWFELAGDTLTYTRSPKDLSSGEINVFAIHECELLRREGENVLELKFPERRLVIQASSADEIEGWEEALHESYKLSTGGKTISDGRINSRHPYTRCSDSSDEDVREGNCSGPKALEGGGSRKLRSGCNMKQQASTSEVGDSHPSSATPSSGSERPSSPRSLLANPAAVGKLHGEGRLFNDGRTSSPVVTTSQEQPYHPDRTFPLETTTVETFEPVPPTPPQESSRTRRASSQREGQRSTARANSRVYEENLSPTSRKRLGVKQIANDENGIATIQLATPKSGTTMLQPDEDWVGSDWDSDDNREGSFGRLESPKPDRETASRPRPHRKPEAFRPASRLASQDSWRPGERTELEDFAPPPETPKSASSLRAGHNPPAALSGPNIAPDADYLEDWDSSDEE
uniref:PH domain-containing protein n=1 Tax=Tetraselmis sp. GSL018 TaxID=582737 RepID=A0A061SN61_9CHLO|mmetsp:Transcript_11121/g.26389  ORF Transcript_11121/g.26389 Transcript_11121/m.26389 type:complete len:443 (+) Transcript_11121:395-1723(+)|eukprot:CAMPEP_0177580712 /NCGR_PEP_ID=MMETSP0419_2-20121207/1729_1 /TAXON_ID=582737 /ORGANISM="Tetraselmis sp., Strain GSL018" /LENGTH=442 /DNA_ID=CAMNT_0019069643 /DNA_START=340 /DNA_END=1668 /DNA_ORIENTATION=-